MFDGLDWSMIIWTGAVFLSGYLLGSRRRAELEPPLEFDVATISPSARADIEQALQSGSKIEAIRVLRKDTGLGLKDSKSVIDRWRTLTGGAPPP